MIVSWDSGTVNLNQGTAGSDRITVAGYLIILKKISPFVETAFYISLPFRTSGKISFNFLFPFTYIWYMEKQLSTSEKAYATAGAILGWIAISGQLYLIILNRTMPVLQTLVKFISFYTILTNILVALCFTFVLAGRSSKWGKFFSRPTVLTAVTVNIVVVGAVYNTILRFLWAPEGFQFVIDELLHSLMPLVFLFYWLIFVPKNMLEWKQVFPWMLYPLVYFIYILTRGALTEQYPYPFIDVTLLGYPQVLIAGALLTIVFFFLSLAFIGIAKVMSRRK